MCVFIDNLLRLRAPEAFCQQVALHYDQYMHSCSGHLSSPTLSVLLAGLTLEILGLDFWVPGSFSRAESAQFRGKELFKEILSPNDETALTYAKRAIEAMSSLKILPVLRLSSAKRRETHPRRTRTP